MKREPPGMFQITPAVPPQLGSLLLAHGSSLGADSPFMQKAAEALARAGLEVSRFNFDYMSRGRKFPPPWKSLVQEYAEIFAAWQAPGPRLVGGKSLGSRVALEVSRRLDVLGVIGLGYPLHPPRKPDLFRLEPLQLATRPTLILQGTRDPFGGPGEFAALPMSPRIRLEPLAMADHDFGVVRQAEDPFERIPGLVRAWLAGLTPLP